MGLLLAGAFVVGGLVATITAVNNGKWNHAYRTGTDCTCSYLNGGRPHRHTMPARRRRSWR